MLGGDYSMQTLGGGFIDQSQDGVAGSTAEKLSNLSINGASSDGSWAVSGPNLQKNLGILSSEQELRRLREQQVELNKGMERIAETLKGKVVLGGALTENNNNNNNTTSDDNNNNNNTASQVHEDLTIGSGGEMLGMSFACRCGWSITFGSDGEKQQFSFVCLCGRFHNFVYMSQ